MVLFNVAYYMHCVVVDIIYKKASKVLGGVPLLFTRYKKMCVCGGGV